MASHLYHPRAPICFYGHFQFSAEKSQWSRKLHVAKDRAHHKEHHWQEKLDSTRLPDGGSSSLGHMEGRWRVLDILGRVLESNVYIYIAST